MRKIKVLALLTILLAVAFGFTPKPQPVRLDAKALLTEAKKFDPSVVEVSVGRDANNPHQYDFLVGYSAQWGSNNPNLSVDFTVYGYSFALHRNISVDLTETLTYAFTDPSTGIVTYTTTCIDCLPISMQINSATVNSTTVE